MKGKDFKAFASMVPDDAVIEYNHYGWNPLEATKLRACISPTAQQPQEQEAPPCINTYTTRTPTS